MANTENDMLPRVPLGLLTPTELCTFVAPCVNESRGEPRIERGAA